jgi:ribosomal protein S18 acetylase RimI-like enzyme
LLTIEIASDMSEFRTLLLELRDWIGIDLEFQHFNDEIANLPGAYDPILLASWDDALVGCVALRPLDKSVCEMKRLFVRSEFRGLHAGRALVERIIEQALMRGFEKMRLDTLPAMTAAMALYRSLGFVEIPPYRFNPVEGTTYMEKGLKGEE